MSRSVIRDIVVPIVSKIMIADGYFSPHRRLDVRDEHLELFLEEAMRRRFGVIGSNGCQHLREQLEEAKKNDPYSFEFLIRRLLEKYVKLAATIRYAKELEHLERDPRRDFQNCGRSTFVTV